MSVECGLQGSARRDSGGATAEACAPSAKFTLPPQTLIAFIIKRALTEQVAREGAAPVVYPLGCRRDEPGSG